MTFRGSKKALPAWGESPFVRECLDWHNLLRARHGVGLSFYWRRLDNVTWPRRQNWSCAQAFVLRHNPGPMCWHTSTSSTIRTHPRYPCFQSPLQYMALKLRYKWRVTLWRWLTSHLTLSIFLFFCTVYHLVPHNLFSLMVREWPYTA